MLVTNHSIAYPALVHPSVVPVSQAGMTVAPSWLKGKPPLVSRVSLVPLELLLLLLAVVAFFLRKMGSAVMEMENDETIKRAYHVGVPHSAHARSSPSPSTIRRGTFFFPRPDGEAAVASPAAPVDGYACKQAQTSRANGDTPQL